MPRVLWLLNSRHFDTARPDWLAMTREVLQAGPWCWPIEHDEPQAYRRALTLVPGGPPVPRPGRVPLVAVRSGAGYPADLLCASVLETGEPPGPVALAQDMVTSLREANTALPHAIPFLWRPFQPIREDRVACLHLASHNPQQGVDVTLSSVKGRSCGLSFLIALASWSLRIPAPDDTIASAEITDSGAVKNVDDESLGAKLAVIAGHAPRIRRILVAEEQEASALEHCRQLEISDQRLKVVGVTDARQVLRDEFNTRALERLLKVGKDPAESASFTNQLFESLLKVKPFTSNLAPVARAVAVALRKWPRNESNRTTLRFVWAVARRHQRNRGRMPMPSQAWFDDHAWARQRVLANLVEHAYDTGTPPLLAVEKIAEQHVGTMEDPMPVPVLHLAGALARLKALRGAYDEAFEKQRFVLERILHEEPGGATFQLSAMYRSAGMLGSRELIRETDVWRCRAEQSLAARNLPRGAAEWAYVEVARARAIVQASDTAGADDHAWAEATLRDLWRNGAVTPEVRFSAGRWLARCLRRQGCASEADDIIAELSVGQADPKAAEVFHALAVLDRAVVNGDTGVAERQLRRLRRLQPAVVRAVEKREPPPDSAPAFVADHFPY